MSFFLVIQKNGFFFANVAGLARLSFTDEVIQWFAFHDDLKILVRQEYLVFDLSEVLASLHHVHRAGWRAKQPLPCLRANGEEVL